MRGIEQFLQVDAATLGALKYAGTWNASTNTPTLASGVGVQGQYYVVSVAGSTNLDGETNWQVGDWAVFNGSVWQKVDGGSTGLLTTLTVTGNTYLATTSGDVGIGTSSPSAKLDVAGAARVQSDFFVYGTGDRFNVFPQTAGSGVNVVSTNNANSAYAQLAFDGLPLIFKVAGTERMRITSAGNVGIGTSSPSSAYSGATLVAMVAATGTTAASLRVSSANASAELYSAGSVTEWGLYSASNSPFSIWTNGNKNLTLDSSGNVGIGTSSPAYKLDVLIGAGSGNLFRAGQSGVSNGYTITSNGSALTHFWATTGEAMRLDSSGNLGLGVTPSADWSASGVLVSPGIFAGTSGATRVMSNVRFSSALGGGPAYNSNGTAEQYLQNAGAHVWYTAPSGTAGNAISFTQAMTLDASGNLSIGQASSALQSGGTGITLYGSSASEIKFLNSTTGSSATDGTALVTSGSDFVINNRESGAVTFGTSNTERARITSGGDLLVGETSAKYSAANRGLIEVNGTSSALLGLSVNNVAAGYFYSNGTNLYVGAPTGYNILFDINGEKARIPAAGGMVVGIAALATTATDGFLYVPTCAGTPTGTPTTQTGTAPIVIDTTNNKLYFYSGGAWRDAGP